jgi:hypothetical protein
MGPQSVATLRSLVILGYALFIIDIVLACLAVARALFGRRPVASTFRKWGTRSQRLFYFVIWLLIVPSFALVAIGQYVPSALLRDIGAIGGLTSVFVMAIVLLL